MNAEEVKRAAMEFGADLAGITPATRLDRLPVESRPTTLSSRIRSVVVVGHRILRGALRGIEEGTNFHSTYRFYGSAIQEDHFLSRTAYQLACRMERDGHEAIPLLSARKNQDGFLPDYQAYAHAAGLGSVGKGGFFLTPRFGHRQRFALVFTDAELDGDPVIETSFCDNCAACVDACPLHALAVSDKPGQPAELKLERCRECRNGAFPEENRADPVDRYAAACGRACLAALEGRTENRFVEPFRKRGVWTIGAPAGEKW